MPPQNKHSETAIEVKKQIKENERYVNDLAEQAESAAKKGDLRRVTSQQRDKRLGGRASPAHRRETKQDNCLLQSKTS